MGSLGAAVAVHSSRYRCVRRNSVTSARRAPLNALIALDSSQTTPPKRVVSKRSNRS